jgi:hypothetical protein
MTRNTNTSTIYEQSHILLEDQAIDKILSFEENKGQIWVLGEA